MGLTQLQGQDKIRRSLDLDNQRLSIDFVWTEPPHQSILARPSCVCCRWPLLIVTPDCELEDLYQSVVSAYPSMNINVLFPLLQRAWPLRK